MHINNSLKLGRDISRKLKIKYTKNKLIRGGLKIVVVQLKRRKIKENSAGSLDQNSLSLSLNHLFGLCFKLLCALCSAPLLKRWLYIPCQIIFLVKIQSKKKKSQNPKIFSVLCITHESNSEFNFLHQTNKRFNFCVTFLTVESSEVSFGFNLTALLGEFILKFNFHSLLYISLGVEKVVIVVRALGKTV